MALAEDVKSLAGNGPHLCAQNWHAADVLFIVVTVWQVSGLMIVEYRKVPCSVHYYHLQRRGLDGSSNLDA